jgi:hypothetical protein
MQDVDAGGEQLFHAGVSAADRIAVKATLEHRVVERICHDVQPGAADGNATSCSVAWSATSSRSSSKARSAVSSGSQTSA